MSQSRTLSLIPVLAALVTSGVALSAASCDGGTTSASAATMAATTAGPTTTSAPSEPPDASAAADLDAGSDASSDADASDDAGDAGDGGDGGAEPQCPDDMVRTSRYVCVDRYEGTLVVLGPDGSVTPHPYYEVPEPDVTYWARSEKDVYPQAYISRVVASNACKAVGKRLCSREEWMRACRGPKGWMYPYGYRLKKDKCNSGKSHLLQEFFGSDPNKWKYDEAFNNPKLAKEPGYLATTGFFPECMSAEGTFDMVGNLHEWVSDTVGDDILDVLDRDKVDRNKQPWREGNGIFMGGFFSTNDQHGPGCTFSTIAHEPRYHDYSTGFRCCKGLPRPPKEKKKKKK